jgi:hypothetical protein
MEGSDTPQLRNIFLQLYPDRLEPSELFEMERDIEGLLAHPGWGLVQRMLSALHDQSIHELTGRTTKPLESRAEYAHKLAFASGVQTAKAAADAVRTIAARERRIVERQIQEPSQAG